MCFGPRTVECRELALRFKQTPSVLSLSRQNLALVRTVHDEENRCARGAYVLKETKGPRDVTLLATASEVQIALNAANVLAAEHNVLAAVVSMPCWELFEAQPADYQKQVLGGVPLSSVEAAARFGWDRWIGVNGSFVGIKGFGASAPAPALYSLFGVTPKAVAETTLSLLP
jgi:transketolase